MNNKATNSNNGIPTWLFITILVLPIFLLLSFFGYYRYTQNLPSDKVAESGNEPELNLKVPAKPVLVGPTSLGMNSLFFGDVFWGRYIDDWSKASDLKFAYPFSGLNTFERENYQAWIADMECPITSTYISSAKQDDLLKFSCPVGYTAEAAKWFTAFTLANNHMDNMQEVDGLSQTRQNLEANKIQYFGHYDNAYRDLEGNDEICEIISLPAKATFPKLGQNEVTPDTQFLLPFALCGYHNVFKLPTESDLAVISKYSKYLPTIIMPHQGKEYSLSADELQQTYFKKMLDLGADAVLGDHTHSVQNTEAYKGKLIVYSMGNFIFDQQSAPLYRQGMAINLNFNFLMDSNLQKWVDLAPSCIKFKDNCLDQAKTLNLTKPKFTLAVDILPTDNSNKLAKKADLPTSEKILQQAKWAETKTKLDYSYAGK